MSDESGSVDTISRDEIPGDPDDLVAIFPTREVGVEFLLDNSAWGLVYINREPVYVAMYVSESVREIKYIAKVKNVVSGDKIDADLKNSIEEYTNETIVGTAKKIVLFEENSLYELEDPIPFKNKHPQNLRYASLSDLMHATTTEDVL